MKFAQPIIRLSQCLVMLMGGVLLSAGAACTSEATNGAPPPSSAQLDFENSAKRPPTARTLYAMAQILATQGKDKDAEILLARDVQQYPTFLPAYCSLAEVQMRHRQIEQAMQTLSRGLQHSPRDPVLTNDYGMCQMVLQDYDGALKTFTRASAAMPDATRYRANMAAALGLLGRYEEAFAIYRQLMPVADAHYNLAVLCDARGDRATATRQFQEAQKLDQSSVSRQ